MKIKMVVVDLEIPPHVKRWGLRLGIPAIVVCAGAVAHATFAPGVPPTPPTWAPNDILTAENLNTAFAGLQSQITGDGGITSTLAVIQAEVVKPIRTVGGKQWSSNAVLCGVAGPTNGQITNGYPGAKALCETACSSASAHMCTSDEVVRSVQLGMTVGGVWYAGGTSAAADCAGWSTSSASSTGAYWEQPPEQPGADGCDNSRDVACCD